MIQDVKLDVLYPYPPERVWQALTNRRALAAWMMDNDFEPRLGHKFRFQPVSLPGLATSIHCEVIELDEPHRLVYTWKDSPTRSPSLVIWTLTAVDGGTRLQLKHHQLSYTMAVGSMPGEAIGHRDRRIEMVMQRSGEFGRSSYGHSAQLASAIEYDALNQALLHPYLSGNWNDHLQKLSNVLLQAQ